MFVYKVVRGENEDGNLHTHTHHYAADNIAGACRKDDLWYNQYDRLGNCEIMEVTFICELTEPKVE